MLLPLLLALSLPPTPQAAPEPRPVYDGRAGDLQVTIPRLDTSAVIDGNLDEPVWRRAALLTGFSQYRPVDGLPAVDSTQVLVWYAPHAIYFGIRAFEPHGRDAVRATLADRDAIDADDNIQILLDTYDDHRRALEFAVNPLGIQEDGVRTEGQYAGAAGGGNANGRFDGVVDLNPDFVWSSRGHLTPFGYEVEVRIPFKSLRYQSTASQTWGLQVVRQVMHSGYEDTWTPVVRANASFLIQSGSLVGLHDLERGLVMDIDPEATTKIEGAPRSTGYGYHGTPELGGTLHWGITNNLGLAATAHPDFSQVEADVAQVTVNQRFALFYPEKRPFFLDGLEQFDTPNRLIYTRQIVQPVAGAKLIGKVGSTNVAYLGAVDTRDPATGKNPVFNVLRVRRDLGASSTLGLVYTDRIEGSDYNRLGGADARVVWRKIWFSELQMVRSWTRDASGDVRQGTLWDATLADRTGRSYGNHFELKGFSPDFVAASGFVNRTNIVSGSAFNRFTWYGKPGALVEEFSTFLMVQPLWRYDDFWHGRAPLEGNYGDNLTATLRGGWSVNAGFSDNPVRFDTAAFAGYGVVRPGADTVPFPVPGGTHHLWLANAGFASPNRPLTVSASVSYGGAAIFEEAAEGRELGARLQLAWKPTQSLRTSLSWTHDRIVRSRDGSEFALANIPRLEVDVQLARPLFVRYIGQYVAQRQAALEDPRTGRPLALPGAVAGSYAPASALESNTFRNDILFSYKPSPGTVFFFGYGVLFTQPEAFSLSGPGLHRETDGFFLKLSYLWRL